MKKLKDENVRRFEKQHRGERIVCVCFKALTRKYSSLKRRHL